jgi:glycosylphosphatidylinositol transamidase
MQMGLALMRCFSRAKWLHHDLIFVIVDQTDKQWAGDEAFMTSQEIPTGKKREAILLDFDTFNFHSLGILTEGFNGELPNLDLVNTAVRLAQYSGVEGISLFKYDHHSDNPRLNIPYPVYLYYRLLKSIREFISKLFGIPKHRIIEDRIFDKSITIMHHAYNQLIGLGTGGHSWYRKYSTHGITLTNANGKAVVSKGRRFNMIAIGKVVEGIVRSMNNLIEELHQSFFLYFMDSTMTYYGFEHYMPDLLAIIAPIIFQVCHFVFIHFLIYVLIIDFNHLVYWKLLSF